MMLIVHPQIAAVGFSIVHQFHPDYTSREILPLFEILDTDTHVAQLCHSNYIVDHIILQESLLNLPKEGYQLDYPLQYSEHRLNQMRSSRFNRIFEMLQQILRRLDTDSRHAE